MKKFILVNLVFFVLITTCLLLGQPYVLKIKVNVANVRMEPDVKSEVVKQLPFGTLLEAKNKLGDWYEIVITDDQGNTQSAYIHHMVVDVLSGEQPKVAEPQPVKPPVREEPRRPVEMQPQRMTFESDYSKGGFKALGGFALASVSTSELAEAEEAGINLDDYKKSRTGFFGGVGYEKGSGKLSLEINVLYMQKGVKYEGEIPSDLAEGYEGDFSVIMAVNEVSVPVLVKLRLMPGSTPYVLGGAEIAYITSANADIEANVSGLTLSQSEDLKENDSIKSIDYGVVVGAGYEMVTGPIPIFIEGRYHLGLADIAGTPSEDIEGVDVGGEWMKTNAIVLLVGIKF